MTWVGSVGAQLQSAEPWGQRAERCFTERRSLFNQNASILNLQFWTKFNAAPSWLFSNKLAKCEIHQTNRSARDSWITDRRRSLVLYLDMAEYFNTAFLFHLSLKSWWNVLLHAGTHIFKKRNNIFKATNENDGWLLNLIHDEYRQCDPSSQPKALNITDLVRSGATGYNNNVKDVEKKKKNANIGWHIVYTLW